jgi:hypothetical protein
MVMHGAKDVKVPLQTPHPPSAIPTDEWGTSQVLQTKVPLAVGGDLCLSLT